AAAGVRWLVALMMDSPSPQRSGMDPDTRVPCAPPAVVSPRSRNGGQNLGPTSRSPPSGSAGAVIARPGPPERSRLLGTGVPGARSRSVGRQRDPDHRPGAVRGVDHL